jgi:hypothetical protein
MEDGPALVPAAEEDFLLLPATCQSTPVPVGPGEIGLLGRIDGRRTLSSVLKKVAPARLRRALSFVAYLVRVGSLELH